MCIRDSGAIDWTKERSLEFFPPDMSKFRCLALAFDVARLGGAAPAWFNAANEVAVEAFLDGRISWIQISEVIEQSLQNFEQVSLESVADVQEVDSASRAATSTGLAKFA